MKRYLILLLLLIFIPFSNAKEYDFNAVESEMDIKTSSIVNIVPTNPDYQISYLKVNLMFYPIGDERQEVLAFETIPLAEKTDEKLTYSWENPPGDELKFSYFSTVKTKDTPIKIKKKIKFPIENLDGEYIKYSVPTENIDSSDEDIIKKASEIVEGEDDLFIAVNKIASWVETNVEYSLNTLTADVSQPASWVLKNKYGVCDELTSLFISMVRSLGIPARFVSGVAYTNWNELNDWGAHAWAEVYFPGYGWVPFDITYKEFGYIDSSHIKLRESLDSNESSTKYEWKGRNVDIETNELDIKVNSKDYKGKKNNPISVKIKPLKEKIGFDSYNLIEVDIENLADYYTTASLYLSVPKEVMVLDNPRKHIYLKPYENKSVYYGIKLGVLNEQYLYTFPVSVQTEQNVSYNSYFESSAREPFYSLDYINEAIKDKFDEEEKKYSKKVNLNCITPKEEYYVYENVSIICTLKNTGNSYLENLNVCLQDECNEISVGISQIKEVSFLKKYNKKEKNELKITAKNRDISKSAFVEFTVLDEPEIEISEVKAPADVDYGKPFSVSFSIGKKSDFAPLNANFLIEGNNIKKEINILELNSNQSFVINLNGNMLKEGSNKIKISAKYEDKNKKEYSKEKEVDIVLNKANIFQKTAIFFNSIGNFIINIFS